MSVLNTFVVIGWNAEFNAPLDQSAKTETWVTRVDVLGLGDLPHHHVLTGVFHNRPVACGVSGPLVSTEGLDLERDKFKSTPSSELEAGNPFPKTPVSEAHQGKYRGNDLLTKILKIKSQDADNWLRQFAALISPQSWETL